MKSALKQTRHKSDNKLYNYSNTNNKQEIVIQPLIEFFGLLIEINKKAKIVTKNGK